MSKIISLSGFDESWSNFFDTIKNRKEPIVRCDGGSIGNFWAFLQSLEEQFHNQIKVREMLNKKVL